MIPAIGPSKLEYPTSQPKMYAWASLSSFQGIISTPMTPVIMPPMRKEMRRGLKFEKSFEGDTTLAATLVVKVATSSATRATSATTGRFNRPSSTTGSQIGSPKISTDADVPATPTKADNALLVGTPSTSPPPY